MPTHSKQVLGHGINQLLDFVDSGVVDLRPHTASHGINQFLLDLRRTFRAGAASQAGHENQAIPAALALEAALGSTRTRILVSPSRD